MSTSAVSADLRDRLRTNLRAASIAATEGDIEGLIAKGFLDRLAAFEELLARLPSDAPPDYLHAWGALNTPPPASSAPAGDAGNYPAGSMLAAAEQIRARQASPTELLEQSLARIAERDGQLNAFQLVLAERARADARQAEQEIAAGEYRGPFHGIPIAVKDLLAMRGTATTAGSRILADWAPAFDAAAVERLQEAGAVIVGKTRLSEFAYSPGSNNAHYGPTRNPWNMERDTGGSSSGSGAAVAAGLVYAALGSDTGGSIRIPAALCGVVGLKPTFGRMSLHGVVPLAFSLDHLGPLTRSVADAALLLQVLSGADPRDPRTRAHVPEVSTDVEGGVRGLRIGVLRDDGSGKALATPEVLERWQSGLAALERGGAQLVPIDVPEIEDLRQVNGAILAMEAAAYHLPNLRTRLGDYGEFMRQRILGAFAYGPTSLVGAQQARGILRQRCARLFGEIDLLSTPTQPDVAPPLNSIGWTVHTGPFNALGWPAVSVPVGLAGGMPVGLQLVGKPWDENTVLRAARVVEAELGLPLV